jgi:plasmid stability protein
VRKQADVLVDRELHRRAKIKAAEEGRSLKSIVDDSLRHFLAGTVPQALLIAVASSGVEHEDPRMDWVTVQIDRGVWEALESYRLRRTQFEGDDEDQDEALASIRRGELPAGSEDLS